MSTADVLVVGGGPAGSVCAGLLARRGLTVVLFDAPDRRPPWSELASPETVLSLRAFGCDPAALGAAGCPCPGVLDTWSHDALAVTEFELVRCAPGWVVERHALNAALLATAARCGVRVVALDAPHARAVDGTAPPVLAGVRGQLLVDATGVCGQVLPPHLTRRSWDDHLVAARLATMWSPPNADWMRLGSASAGWWYTLPNPRGGTQAVFMTDGDVLPSGETRMNFLADQFQEAFGVALVNDDRLSSSPLEVRAARTSYRQALWGHYGIPIGDAAYALDPLTGGGIGRALGMASRAADTVWRALAGASTSPLREHAATEITFFREQRVRLTDYYRSITKPEIVDRGGPFWLRRRAGRKQTANG